jgi:hypothetical protein
MKLLSLLPYLLIAAGLFSTLALFLTLKHEIRRHTRGYRLRIEQMLVRLNEAETAPRLLAEVFVPDSAPQPAVMYVPAPLRAGLNLNNRVHALRMLRRGEDVSHIAAALGVPRREVELMIRVSSLGKTRAAGAGQS